MKINVVMLIANSDSKVLNSENVFVHLTDSQLSEVQKYQYAGGFKRFSIDVYDEEKERENSRFYKINREMADRQVEHFLKSNLIIN